MMLSEKYRPTTFDTFGGMEREIKFLKEKINSEDGIPHLLLIGPPGTGKSSLAHVIGNEVLGKYKEQNFFEFNASNDNGVDFVRSTLAPLAKRKQMGTHYKIILLDEADYMTPEAQACCRRIMELSSNITRFILTANYPYKIIQPIISRCQTIEFKQQPNIIMKNILSEVMVQENIQLTPTEMDEIVIKANGDFRKMYSLLELDNSAESLKQFDSLTLENLRMMPTTQRVQLAFVAEPYEVFNKLWEILKKEQAWKYLSIFADCNAKMNNSMHKNLFLANLLEKLGS